MPILRALILTVILAGCGVTAKTPGTFDDASEPESESAETRHSSAKYQYVGTFELFPTPMGSSITVLMVDGRKIKITNVDGTRYINISVDNGIPEMRIAGTYGINGELRKSNAGSGDIFIVREIEHLGGGQDPVDTRKHRTLPDFFSVDGNARGPLTLSELQIRFPGSLERYFDNEGRECFHQQVEIRAADLGDPQTLPPIRRVLLISGEMRWEEMTDADKRLQLARYVTSMALHAC